MISPILQERKLRVASSLRACILKLGSAADKLYDLRQVYLTSLSLSLHIYKTRIIKVAT